MTITLPLLDGCIFIDNSFIELLTTCPRAMQYNRFEKRILTANKPSLAFGSALHLALEHRYKTYANHAADVELYSQQVQVLSDFFATQIVDENDYRNLNWACEIIRRYNNRYEIEEFQLLTDAEGKPQVEMAFALPLFVHNGINVIYTGKIDLPVMWNNELFIIDHKSTSMLGPSFGDKMKMSAQQRGYCWAFEQLSGKTVKGYCINAIRVKEPPIYLMDPNSPRKGKSTVESWWAESFVRERYYLRPGDLDEWKSNLIALIKEMFWHYEQGYLPMKTAWCNVFGKCQYFDVCTLPPEDRSVMLSSGLFTDNKWDPLHKK